MQDIIYVIDINLERLTIMKKLFSSIVLVGKFFHNLIHTIHFNKVCKPFFLSISLSVSLCFIFCFSVHGSTRNFRMSIPESNGC